MRYVVKCAAGLAALGALCACHSTTPRYLTGAAAITTPGARSDALWMIALPPVTVLVPKDSAVAAARRHDGGATSTTPFSRSGAP